MGDQLPGDRVLLTGMRFAGRHGVSSEERRHAQPIDVDVILDVDLGPAGRADDLGLTVDYARVHALVRDVVEARSFRLVEAIAEAIAAEILAGEPQVRGLVIRVRKPEVQLGRPIQAAGVEIHRRRT